MKEASVSKGLKGGQCGGRVRLGEREVSDGPGEVGSGQISQGLEGHDNITEFIKCAMGNCYNVFSNLCSQE